jgi:SAM-dependent methyltransferase
MADIAEQDLQAVIRAWDQAAWSLAALALTARGDGPPELTAAAGELLAAAGLTAGPGTPLPGLGTAAPGQVASQAAAALHQASALAGGRGYEWSTQSDEALVAQGRVSAQRAVTVAGLLVPVMDDLAGRLAAPGARLLDVGTGTGELAVAFARVFPQVHVLGIDILDRALGLARQAIAASGAGARVTVRKQDVTEFADDAGFDLAWLPAPFIAGPALRAGLPRVVAALRPGGWLVVGHGRSGGTPAQDALARLKTLAYGGTPIDGAAACQLLHQAGLSSVRTVPTPAGAPAITIGQKPA